MLTESDNPVKKIEVTFADGSTEEWEKAFAGTFNDGRLKIEFANMSGEDVLDILFALLEFAATAVRISENGGGNDGQTEENERQSGAAELPKAAQE